MKWVTYRSDQGDWVGVVEGDDIHALAPGTALVELVARGAGGLREAGERAMRQPHEVVPLTEATLRAPIPRPPAIRDCLCFLDHMRNAGDLLFIGCTPIVWEGPIANWVTACDTMLALDASTVVPGHGPITDADGIRAVRGYLTHVVEQADAAHDKGLTFRQAAATVDLAEYATWLDPERIVVNLYQRYRELDPGMTALAQTELLALMAEWDARR
jgi:hypothetical protein